MPSHPPPPSHNGPPGGTLYIYCWWGSWLVCWTVAYGAFAQCQNLLLHTDKALYLPATWCIIKSHWEKKGSRNSFPWGAVCLSVTQTPLWSYFLNMIVKEKNSSPFQKGTIFQNGCLRELLWLHFFSQCRYWWNWVVSDLRFLSDTGTVSVWSVNPLLPCQCTTPQWLAYSLWEKGFRFNALTGQDIDKAIKELIKVRCFTDCL